MKVTVKVWTLATDTENGPEATVYWTEEDFDKGLWEFFELYMDDDDDREAMRKRFDEDPSELWEEIARGSMDSYTTDEHKREIDVPLAAGIGIRLEGGVIQSVFSDNPDACPSVYVVDYDVEGCDESELIEIPQDGGGSEMAEVPHMGPPDLDKTAAALFSALEAA